MTARPPSPPAVVLVAAAALAGLGGLVSCTAAAGASGATPAEAPGREAPAAPSDTPPPDTVPEDTLPGDTVPGDTVEGPEAAADTAPEPDDFRDYDEVITGEAVTDSGVFVTHRVEEDLYYEIPEGRLGPVFLWVSRIARAQAGTGYGGEKLGSRVVRWERRGDRILLRNVSYEVTADSADPVYHAVRQASFEPVLQSFDIETFSPEDSTPVIEVSDLFTAPPPEFSPRERLRASSLARDRSFLEEVLAFPENLEVEALLTFRTDTAPGVPGAGSLMDAGSLSTISVVVHHSMVRLPEETMQPRLADDRVGFFEVRQYDYSLDEHRAPRRRMINRWRLEKEDPDAGVSEPVEPIVFWVGRGTPEEWRPWVERGIEAWQDAFRGAGFEDAVVARRAPAAEEDPEWHPEDARHSVVRWQASTIENAMGPHVHDPRSGEILEADVQIYHNVLSLLREWYFTQAAPLDERAQDLPMPDSLMGRLVEYVVAHEVGHSLGFPHNMKASSAYPVDSLRSESFTERHGTVASIMDYGRMNYVAQPGDDARLIPEIGPYDEFAVQWGYQPIPGGPEEERERLREWARRQGENPHLRFGHAYSYDPTAQTEDLGDDPVEATRYGLRNVRRTADLLLEAAGDPGDPYDDLRELYRGLVGQWSTELGHVVQVVGGVERREKRYGQEGPVFDPVPAARQREAVAFLNEHAFRPPEHLVEPGVLRLVEPEGAVSRVRARQVSLLERLLANDRLERLIEQQAVDAAGAPGPADAPGAAGGEVPAGRTDAAAGQPYGLLEMLEDVRRGVWSELYAGEAVGTYRRNLQRAWVELMGVKLETEPPGGVVSGPVSFRFGPQPPGYPNDIRSAARGELRDVRSEIEARLSDVDDRATRLHLIDARERIGAILGGESAGG